MSARHIGTEARVAWLLATTRILHPDQEITHRERFVAALRERGVSVDNTRISRWESGTQAASQAAIRGYEEVLGLGQGSLAAVTMGLRRTFGENGYQHHYSPERHDDAGDLDHLLDAVLTEQAHGVHWQRLAAELTAYDRVFLREQEWQDLSTRLVRELSRSVGLGYVRRYEAAATLIRHPSAQRFVSMAIGQFVMDEDTQVIGPVLRLYSEVSDPVASSLVLRMLSSDSKGLRRAASSVAAAKLRLGHFPESSMQALEMYAATAIRSSKPLDGGLDAFDLAMQLPFQNFEAVMAAARDRRVQRQLGEARSTGELVSRNAAARVVADLAVAVQNDTDGPRHSEPDMMMRRLLREALFHNHKMRRDHAAMLLTASPYRLAVSRQCQQLIGVSDYFLAARAWALLMKVGLAGRRPEIAMRALTEVRPTLQARALVNLGLSDEPISPGEARAILNQVSPDSRGSVRAATLFALGMSGAPEIEKCAVHEEDWYSRAAIWWMKQGPALHEPELLPGEA
ncbi:hypothetical protein ACFP3Q_07960 [Nocardioides sp. GCM10027113]|uniref:hypothetical protein n=1 Tax=unclassified Nocardioides TaxID=2615069 RepID=UPI003621CE1E